MDAHQRKGLRRREKLARRQRRTHGPTGARGPSKSDTLRALDIVLGVAREHRQMVQRRAMHRNDAPRCGDCGGYLRKRPNADALVEVTLEERYPPALAMLIRQVIEQNPPPDRRIDFLEGDRFVQWRDAGGELHKLDTTDTDDLDDEGDDETPLQAVDPEQLAAVISKRGQA